MLAFFLLTGISYAQTFREARIFIPKIAGVGMQEGDNDYFLRQVSDEVVLQNRKPLKSWLGCDYILRGSIEQYSGRKKAFSGPVPEKPIPRISNRFGRREYFSWEVNNGLSFFDSTGEDNLEVYDQPPDSAQGDATGERVFSFKLELLDKDGEAVGEQRLLYTVADDSINDSLSAIVFALISGLENFEVGDNFLYLEAGALWSPRIYSGSEINSLNFGARLTADFHFTDSMAFSLGAQFVGDTANEKGKEYKDFMIEIPMAVKFLFKPSDQFMLEPCIGISINFSLSNSIEPSPFLWFAGLQFGTAAGIGIMFIEQRFSMDFMPSKLGDEEYRRFMLQVAVGYKFGFLPKSRPSRED